MNRQNNITLHDDKVLSGDGLIKDSCVIIEQDRQTTFRAVNEILAGVQITIKSSLSKSYYLIQ